jgi:tRNA 2-selenouridine synthase
VAQPSQKHFDTLIWSALREFNSDQPVYVESESKKVGNVSVPESLITAMRQSPCLNVELSDTERVALLLEDYDFFVTDTEHFCRRLQVLTELRGKEVINRWVESVRAGSISAVVQELLTIHYDPVYLQSMKRNFTQYNDAIRIAPADHTKPSIEILARMLLQS